MERTRWDTVTRRFAAARRSHAPMSGGNLTTICTERFGVVMQENVMQFMTEHK